MTEGQRGAGGGEWRGRRGRLPSGLIVGILSVLIRLGGNGILFCFVYLSCYRGGVHVIKMAVLSFNFVCWKANSVMQASHYNQSVVATIVAISGLE